MNKKLSPREIEAMKLAASGALTVELLRVMGKYASYEGARDCVNRLAARGIIERYDYDRCPIVKRWFYRLTDAGKALAKKEEINVK